MKNTRCCPKCHSGNIVRVPDNPARHASGMEQRNLIWAPTFAAYLAKKRAEGKHYNIALSHAAKKLVRLIFAMEKSRQPYCSAT